MTTGSYTRGTPNAGQWLSKTWSGGDWSSRSKPQRSEKVPYESIRMRVYHGRQQIYIVHKYSLKRQALTRIPRSAQIEEHAYSMSGTRGNLSQIPYRYNGGAVSYTRLAGINGIPQYMPTAAEKANLQLALLGKLRESVAGSSFNAGVFIGESKEALATIRDGAERIYGAYHAFKRGDPYLAAKKLTRGTPREHLLSRRHVYADNWLQLQYGWLPLLQDVKDGAEFIAHQLNYPRQEVVRVRKSGFPNGSGNVPWTGTDEINWSRAEKEYTLSIKAILKEKNVVLLSGLLDPVSVAWELMPYSFVIDWFIPVGNYLSALSLNCALSGTFVTTERSRFKVLTPKLVKTPGSPFDYFQGAPGGDYYETFSMNRSVSSSLSVPLPGFKNLDKVASFKHTVNAVALLVNPLDKAFRKLDT